MNKSKIVALTFLMMAVAHAADPSTGVESNLDDDETPKIQFWFNSTVLSGIMIMIFITIVGFLGFSELASVQVPIY